MDTPQTRRRLVPLALLAALLALLFWWGTGGGEATEAADSAGALAKESRSGPRGKGPSKVAPSLAVLEDLGGTISGKVLSSEGGPVAGADVCARTNDAELGSAQTRTPMCTKSGPDGAYQLTGLFRVRWGVGAAARGYIPQAHRERDVDFLGIRLDMKEDERGIDITLTPGGVEIAGIVKDLGGGVVEGAFVSSSSSRWSQYGGNWGAVAHTNAEGEFTLWVEEGDAHVSADAEGYSRGSDRGVAPGMYFTVILTPESVLAGVVRDEAGKPVPGAKVSADSDWFMSFGSGNAISDEDGRYRIEGLDAGRYKPTAEVQGAYGQARTSVRLGIGESADDVDVLVYPAAFVSASVVSEDRAPCEQGSFRIKDRKTKVDYWAALKDGAGEIKAVRPGHYEVSIDCRGYVSKGEYPAIDVERKNITGLTYTVSAGRTLRGIVVTADGKGIAEASVMARRDAKQGEDSSNGFGQTEDTGRFELSGLKPGAYKVTVRAKDVPATKDPIEVEVAADTDPDELRIELEVPGGVRGRVTDPAGKPVGGVRVAARGPGQGSARVKDDGTYELTGLRAGDYRVAARGDRWSDTLRKPGSSDDDVQGEAVVVVAGEVQELDLVVESREGTIEGTVVDEGSGPLADAYISVNRESDSATAASGGAKQSSRWSWGTDPILTDVDGRFFATGLADGAYTIRAYRKGGGEGFVEHVQVGTTSAEIKIEVEGSMEGRVQLEGGDAPETFDVLVNDKKAGFRRSETFMRTDGRWSMHELPAGTFDVIISATEGTSEQKAVVLAAGEALEGLDGTLEGLTTIRGRVLSLETNEPIAGVVVSASKPGAGTMFSFGDKRGKELTAEDGTYELENAPTGKLTLRTMPVNFADWRNTGNGSLLVVAEPGIDLQAPDIFIPEKKVKGADRAGDLGYKINETEVGAEIENHPKVVGFIRPAGPAADSGLEIGDVIVKVDGHDVTGAELSLYGSLTEVLEGTTVKLGLARGETIAVTAGPPI